MLFDCRTEEWLGLRAGMLDASGKMRLSLGLPR